MCKFHRFIVNIPPPPLTASPEEWWQWYKMLEDSDLFSIFAGQLRSSLKCKACNEESLTFDPFWELSVSLPKVSFCYSAKVASASTLIYSISPSSLAASLHQILQYLHPLSSTGLFGYLHQRRGLGRS